VNWRDHNLLEAAMGYRLCGSTFLACVTAVAIAGGAQSQSADNGCSMDRMEENPRSVIEPCTRRLQSDISGKERGQTLFIRGRGYHRSGQVALAAEDYDAALTLIPDNEELWLSRSNAAYRLGDWKAGNRYLAQAHKLNPKNPNVIVQIGQQADLAGSPTAYDFYTRALAIDPAHPYALLLRAKYQFRERQFKGAFGDIDALIALDPKTINRIGYVDGDARTRDFHIVARAYRAHMFEMLGQYDKAEQELNSAIAYKRSAESLTARAEFLIDRPGRLQNALADLEEATSLDVQYRPAAFNKGMALVRLDRIGDAFAAFDAAIAIDPEDYQSYFMRARMHRSLGRTEAATADMWAAIELNPSVLLRTMPALRRAGYWTSRDDPQELTQELQDAIQACMIDTTCN
jgi:tetratricopeptide (TPR) repeat protein